MRIISLTVGLKLKAFQVIIDGTGEFVNRSEK
jgi:hypothetical protein